MNKLNIIFDLDETLIQTITKNEQGMVHNFNSNPAIVEFPYFSNIGCIQFPSNSNEPSPVYIVAIRSGTKKLLDYCYQHFNVSFWTAGSYDYAREVLKLLITEEQYKQTKVILATYQRYGNYINLKQNVKVDYIEIDYKINEKDFSPKKNNFFEKSIGISSNKKYFVAEKELFTFPYLETSKTIIEKGKSLSKYIIYNSQKLKDSVIQYDIRKYFPKTSQKSNDKSNMSTDELWKPLNMLWENPNFNKMFNAKNTLMVDDHAHVKYFYPKNTIYITAWCRMESTGPVLKYFKNKKEREWIAKNRKELPYEKREDTILLEKFKKWLHEKIIKKKVTNIQNVKLIDLGQTFKMFDLVDGKECRVMTPFENGGNYEKYLSNTCSTSRDCVIDITNDIEKFRLKMKKTVDSKYSSLVDDNVDKLLSNILRDHINNEVDYDNMMGNPDLESERNQKKESKLVLGYETKPGKLMVLDRFEPNFFNWWQTQKIISQQSKKSSKKSKKSQKRKSNLKAKSIKKSKNRKKSKTKK